MKNSAFLRNFERTILTEQTLSPTLISPVEDRPPPAPSPLDPLVPTWIDQELLDKTYRVWFEDYGENLTQAEAVEILENLRRFAEVIIRASAGDRT